MPTDPGTLMIIGLSAILLIWFGVGILLNRRRGREFVSWLWQASQELGEGPSVRWMGTSGLRVSLAEAAEPFSQVQLIAILEPREILLWWPIHRFLRRQRDQLVIRAQLRSEPRVNLAVLDSAHPLARAFRARVERRDWQVEAAGEPSPLLLAYPPRSQTSARLAQRLAALVADQPIPVWVLSASQQPPHLLMVLPLPGPDSPPAGPFVASLREVGRLVSNRVG